MLTIADIIIVFCYGDPVAMQVAQDHLDARENAFQALSNAKDALRTATADTARFQVKVSQ